MRLPFGLTLSRRGDGPSAPSPAHDYGEVGIIGTRIFGGRICEEYNPKLTGDNRWKIYDQMLHDEQVRAVRAMISLLIRSAPMRVQAASDSPTDIEAAELIKTNLRSGMTMTWDDLLRDALNAIFFGFTLAEKVWEERDGYVMLRKLAPRHPRTVYKWDFDEHGGLAGVVQQGPDAQGTWHTDLPIPIDRLVVWTSESLLGNPEGDGLLRAMYRPWFCKDFALTLLNVLFEKQAQRIPQAEQPREDTSEANRKYMLDLLSKIRSGERVAIVVPPGWKIADFLGEVGSVGDQLLKAIDRCDQSIARSALAQVMMLGQTETGARALADPLVQVFLCGEDAIANWICEGLNRYVVPDLCSLNWPGLPQFPKVVMDNVGARLEVSAIAQALMSLSSGSLLTPGPKTEEHLRELFGLPEEPSASDLAPGGDGGPAPSRPGAPSETSSGDQPAGSSPAGVGTSSSAPRRSASDPAVRTAGDSPASETFPAFWRPPTDRETAARIDLTHATRSDAEDNLRAAMQASLDDQLGRLARSLRPSIEAAVSGGVQARNRLLAQLAGLEVPELPRYRALLRRHLSQIAEAGIASLGMAGGDGASAPSQLLSRLRADLDHEADALARKHASDLVFAVRSQVTQDLDAGLTGDRIVRNVKLAAQQVAAIGLSDRLHQAADRLTLRLSDLSGD
jgi:hypothetical protein